MQDFRGLERAFGPSVRDAASREQYLQQKYPGVSRDEALRREAERYRPLTSGEVQLARSIFGSLIKYEKVKVFNRKWRDFMHDGRAHAPDGNLYYDDRAGYLEDFSAGNMDVRSTFIHEMAHVWQFQRGELLKTGIIVQAKEGNVSYIYAHIFGRGSYNNYYLLRFEAQAEFLSDYYRIMNGRRAAIPANLGFGRADYERIMPAALRAAAMARTPTS